MLYVKYFSDGGALVEDTPHGEQSVAVKLDERAAKTLAALLALESFELAHALASLYEAGKRGRAISPVSPSAPRSA